MTDPTALNEILKQAADAYRIFSMELKAVQIKKADLVKAILERVDREKIADIKKITQQIIYERTTKN
jgi:hypothetical protein